MLPWAPTRDLAVQTQNYLQAFGGGNVGGGQDQNYNHHHQYNGIYNGQPPQQQQQSQSLPPPSNMGHPQQQQQQQQQHPTQQQLMHQQRQQQQQQQQSNQNNMAGSNNNNNNNNNGGSGPNQPQNPNVNSSITLPQVLHYLQSTHRTHLSLQNSWEIERAELRARVALLEGEKRSWEQAKTDLARRVRMLEWALKMERSKYLSQNQAKDGNATHTLALPAGKLAALRTGEMGTGAISPSGAETPPRPESPKFEDGSSTAPRPNAPALTVSEPNNNNPSDQANPTNTNAPTISIAQPLPAVAAQNMLRFATNGGGLNNNNGNTWAGGTTTGGMATMMAGFGTAAMGIGRDPKARARSRDYLKQCLQEINYLTSIPVINPLPQHSSLIPGIERPRKTLNELPNHNPHFQTGGVGIQNSHSPGPQVNPNHLLNKSHTMYAGNLFDPQQQQQQQQQQQPQQRAGVYQVNPSDIHPHHQQPPSNFGPPPSHSISQVGAPVMTRARSSSRPLLSSGPPPPPMTSTTSLQPLTVANLPLLSPTESSGSSSGTIVGHDAFPPPSSSNVENTSGETSEGGGETGSGVDKSSVPTISSSTITEEEEDPSSKEDDRSERSSSSVFDEDSRLTAIYRPESSDAWKEQLRIAGEKEKLRMSREKESGSSGNMVEDLANLSLGNSNEEGLPAKRGSIVNGNGGTSTVGGGNGGKEFEGYKVWKPKRTLRSHLDAARCMAFDRSGLAIVSGSDDCTVKLWRLNPVSISNPSPSTWPETEPQITFRGHSATVTSVAISSSPPRIYSASLDSTVMVWSLPPPEHETYAPFDPRSLLARFVGHTDGIWDMVLLPLRLRDEALLATVSADGTIKVWSTDELNSPLKLSWNYFGTESRESSDESLIEVIGMGGKKVKVCPTCVTVIWSDLKKVGVGFNDSVVKVFELETGKMSMRLKSDESFDGTTGTQVNSIITHPTLPLLISAHEDGYIRLFDLNTGACTHSMIAHLDSITSLSIDPTGLNLVSGGHDCSIRFWDLTGSRICLQEISSHRPKAGEGVLDVLYHPVLPFVASSGADGSVKVFG